MADSVRRSGRMRKPNFKYALDLANKQELGEVESLASSVDASSFEHDTDQGEEDIHMDEDFGLEDSDAEMETEEDGLLEASSDELLGGSTTENPLDYGVLKNSQRKSYNRDQANSSRVRGCLFHLAIRNRNVAIHQIAGHDDSFVEKLKAEMYKYVETFTVPSRELISPGRHGLCHPEIYCSTIRTAEEQSFLAWYMDNKGWKSMSGAQSTKGCDLESRKLYIDTELPPQHLFLGPYTAQQLFILNLADSISVSQAWQTATSNTGNSNEYDSDACNRPAWILNLGSRVLSMDWAPNQDGDYQFLAVSVGRPQPESIPEVSSFEPVEPYEASVQIWAFSTVSNGDTKLMDMNKKPKLVHVLCAKWGTIRRLSWCPAAVSITKNSQSIGLLATISTDGFTRIVDVCVDLENSNPYVKYEAAAFASKPPNTICTCLSWLSASQIAAGCADGHVAIWDVGRHITTKTSSIAVPYWYHALHTTYIISVIAHQPYPCQYIATNAVDGHVRVTSIRNPYVDTVYGSREHHLMPPLCPAPHILGFYEIDEMEGLRARLLRHIPMARIVGKATAQIISIDAGKTHPCLLVGSSDGNIFVTNPLRKVFIRRIRHDGMASWQQVWFKHEFVPETRRQPTDHSSSLLANSKRQSHLYPRKGVSRFLESLKIERFSAARGSQRLKDDDTSEINVDEELATPESVPPVTANRQDQDFAAAEEAQISIYEEEQAVTSVSWNTNVCTGGWAAAGMANGLLRVEDLAI